MYAIFDYRWFCHITEAIAAYKDRQAPNSEVYLQCESTEPQLQVRKSFSEIYAKIEG